MNCTLIAEDQIGIAGKEVGICKKKEQIPKRPSCTAVGRWIEWSNGSHTPTHFALLFTGLLTISTFRFDK